MKYLLLAALLVGLRSAGDRTSAHLTPPRSPEAMIVRERGRHRYHPSHHSVDETVDKLKNILRSKEITLFVLIDHSEKRQRWE